MVVCIQAPVEERIRDLVVDAIAGQMEACIQDLVVDSTRVQAAAFTPDLVADSTRALVVVCIRAPAEDSMPAQEEECTLALMPPLI
ncbi:hypothetical protein SAMN04490186_3877 [Pseudomonas grimontii]|uniref:Uncharacterized protein n=1 Tax=Pseudomonas grimontii TaxID=129847 RepID=A0ABY0TP62_9PSED|nr:hypothetical protein SAMN04490186_3877 [Pseudomonas grimontii]